MTVRPTLNKYFEITASSVALLAVLSANSLSEDSAFAC